MEDILSINQRPKMDEVDGILFCLLNMLYYNDEKQTVEQDRSVLHWERILWSVSRKMRTVMYLTRFGIS